MTQCKQHSTGRDTCLITAINCAHFPFVILFQLYVIFSLRDAVKDKQMALECKASTFDCLLQFQAIITPTQLLVYCHPISGTSQQFKQFLLLFLKSQIWQF